MSVITKSVDKAAKRCFVITPIGADQSDERRHANMVFEVALRPLLEARGFSLERSDLATEPGQITAAIFSAINEADLCIADLSYLNPNVMYELGVRHTLQKAVVQIAVSGTKLPFDAVNQRTIFFDVGDVHSLQGLSEGISKQIDWLEANPDKISNPLTSALGFFENALKADPESDLIGELSSRLSSLEAEVGSEGISKIAAAVRGQGDLATKNTRELRRIWQADQIALALDWQPNERGFDSANYRGFNLQIAPESKGRWSSHAKEIESGYSVPWPVWQASANDAKSTIVRAVDDVLAEKGL